MSVHVKNESSHQNIQDLNSPIVPLAAAYSGYNKKINHHQSEHDAAGISFIPIVFEVSGGMHPAVIDFVTYCAKIYANNHPGSVPSYVTSYCPNFKRYWLMRLSVANLFGTANAIVTYKRRPLNMSHKDTASGLRTSRDYALPYRQYVKRPLRR